jgi:hypothetical protein
MRSSVSERKTIMRFPTLAARLASATLLGTLAFGVAGVGSVAAASSQHASINVAANPAAAAQIGPGSIFTDTFVLSDPDNAGTHGVSVMMTYPGTVQLQGVQFSRSGAWVDATMLNGFDAQLGDIGSHGDSVTITASFMALPGYTAGAPLTAQLESTWHDNLSTSAHHNMSAVPMLSAETMQPGAAPATWNAGAANVTGAGFTPGEAVTFWYNRPDGTAAPLYIRNGQLTTDKVVRNATADASGNRDVANATAIYADASGRISISFPIAGLTPGAYSIVAHGTVDQVNVVVPFNV